MNIKIGTGTLNQTPLDWEGNKKNIIECLNEAGEQGIEILCLPELCITGYGCEDMFQAKYIAEKALKVLNEIRYDRANKEMYYTLGLPMIIDGFVYNCIVFLFGDKIIGIVPKKRLAKEGIHYETRWFKEWEKERVEYKVINELYTTPANTTPVGDIIFKLNNFKLGFEICEEAWVPDRSGQDLAKRGVDIILNPSASHFSFGKNKVREDFIREGSRSFGAIYVYTNLLGNEAGRTIYDGDMYIAENGEIIKKSNRFSFKNYNIMSAFVDPEECQQVRMSKNYNIDRDYENKTTIEHWTMFKKQKILKDIIVNEEFNKFEEFEEVVALGLYDYMRKSHSKGFTLSLSGGYDSSIVACLVKAAWNRMPEKEKIEFGMFRDFLTVVYQRSENSSTDTEIAAEKLAKELQANFCLFKIDDIVENYTEGVQKILGRQLTWENDGITLQNIQARVRNPSVWMIANANGSLLLTTSNRSEAAVGYATMDGDTAGGLNPIGGVDKDFIRQWVKWKKREIESLKYVIDLEPSAELKPREEKQTDEKDLMSYELLNRIEELFVCKKKNPRIIVEILKNEGYDDVEKNVEKFLRLWGATQWKREKYAVSFHLDDYSLDPKTCCRYPILNKIMKIDDYV